MNVHLTLAIVLSSPFWACAQTQVDIPSAHGPVQVAAEDDMKRLIVLITAGSVTGAGIIVGTDSNRTYIVTANHVVRPGGRGRQYVKFRWTEDSVSARLEPQFDARADIALLSVSAKDARFNADEASNLPFDHIRYGNIKRYSEAFVVGHPNGRNWYINVRPGMISAIEGDRLLFESEVAPGDSGGGLLDSNRELIGMIINDNPPVGEAATIQSVVAFAEKWAVPIQLGGSVKRQKVDSVGLAPVQNATDRQAPRDDLSVRRQLQEEGRYMVQGSSKQGEITLNRSRKGPGDVYISVELSPTDAIVLGIDRDEIFEKLGKFGTILTRCCNVFMSDPQGNPTWSSSLMMSGSNTLLVFDSTKMALAQQIRDFLHRWLQVSIQTVSADGPFPGAFTREAVLLGGVDMSLKIAEK